MIYKYGIDFGTTNSSIAIRFVGDDNKEHTKLIELKDTLPKEIIPSVVLADDEGNIIAGEDALDQYIQGAGDSKGRRFIKQIKLELEKKGSRLNYTVSGKRVAGVDAIAAIFKVLRLKAEKEATLLGIEMSGVVLGVPVQYGDIQKNVLKQALFKAGFYESMAEAEKETEFVSEPVAVAIHYGIKLERDTTVLVFDFGGGTLDLAIVNLKNQVAHDRLHPHETIAKERITLGGEELTRLFFIKSFCAPEKYGTKKICSEFGFRGDLSPEALWEKLLQCEDGIRFIAAVERCKCALSVDSKNTFSFIGKDIQFEDQVFYRNDFEDAIENKLDDIDSLIRRCLESGKINDPYDIDQVILAGGSSMIPAVQRCLIDIFGPQRVSGGPSSNDTYIKAHRKNKAIESEVLTSIVRGLAIVGCKNGSLIDDIVDCDYGVWDTVRDNFVPIILKDTRVKDTVLDKISCQGIHIKAKCSNPDLPKVKIEVYQRNLTGKHKIGTIEISDPGGREYLIYMEVDKKQAILVVSIYDDVQKRWFDEIPLDERQYFLE